ncbi:rCG37875, partial [Rattus norvegicus]
MTHSSTYLQALYFPFRETNMKEASFQRSSFSMRTLMKFLRGFILSQPTKPANQSTN